MKIHLIRHGEVNHNLYGIYCKKDEKLNYMGLAQAFSLGEKLKNIHYDIIFSSPLLRAKHTARIINSAHKQIIIDNRLTERDPGSLSGQSFRAVIKSNK